MSSIELVRAKVLNNPDKFRKEFCDWITENYHVFEYFEKSAKQVVAHGFKHYSARTIVEVMRHRSNVREIHGEFKINDHHTPDMARLFMMLNPEHTGLFEFRARRVVE